MQRFEWKGFLQGGQWKEATLYEVDGVKLTSVSERWALTGELEGSGEVHYLLAYRRDGSVDYTGFESLDVHAGDRTGKIVLETRGRFEGMTAKGIWAVVPAMCTGAFAGVTGGDGEYSAHGHDPAPFTLRVELSD